MSGEYAVSLNVTGRHYLHPGIEVRLPRKYIVVDEIDMVKLRANHNASALIGNYSTPVNFLAR